MNKYFKLPVMFYVICLLQLIPMKEVIRQKLDLNPLFSDHMVLQQETKAAIWGKSEPKAEIVVSGSWGQSAETRADNDGSWITKLKTPEAGGPFYIIIASKTDTVILNDVMIGEVWLCSGQSNMEMQMQGWPL